MTTFHMKEEWLQCLALAMSLVRIIIGYVDNFPLELYYLVFRLSVMLEVFIYQEDTMMLVQLGF